MPRYNYSALSDDGRVLNDWMETNSVSKLRQLLQLESKVLLHHSVVRYPIHTIRISGNKKRSLVQRFCESVGMLLNAGIMLPEALGVMAHTDSRDLSDVCRRMTHRLASGMSFSQCLQSEHGLFLPLQIRIISLGEKTGTLCDALNEVSRSVEWQSSLRRKARESLSYPFITIVATLIMSLFLFVQVVPVMRAFVESVGEAVPWYTRSLFGVSEWVQGWWLLLILLPTGLAVAGVLLPVLFPGLQRVADRYSLSIWFLGPIVYRLHLADFSHHMALLNRSGLGLPDCLEGCRYLSNNQYLQQGIAHSKHRLDSGDSLTISLRRSCIFPEFLLQAVAVGEAAGRVDNVFTHLAELYRRESDVRIRLLQALIGPAVMVMLGMIVLWIVLSLFSPLYGSLTMMSGGRAW